MKSLKKTMTAVAALLLFSSALSADTGQDTERLKAKIEAYARKVDKQPDWLLSRLQMYWKTHATDVYICGEKYSHASGRAPVPTVKLNGSRGMESAYNRPKLEEVVPYDDDEQGSVTYINKVSGRMEKAHPAKTGCNIASLNRQILGIARDAAKVYAATGEERYARMASGVFDTYMKGIYHRNVPVDLNHGHQQTLVGITTFEVIHEDAINELTETYTLLRSYMEKSKMPSDIYDGAFKKWADNIIANGVPHNNWNLYQAEFIYKVAKVLDDDKAYSDGKGRQYYIDCIVNKSSIRQWSMKKLAEYGFDTVTGMWCESPGYSMGVIGDFCHFANELDREAGIDLFREIPVLTKAVLASAQYLFPNRMVCGFGDTHPCYIPVKAIDAVIEYAHRHGDKAMEKEFETFRTAVAKAAPAEEVGRYVSPVFHAPNVSWLIQRTGMNSSHDLSVSLNGSLGNHQHANGISMELYGKGFVLGPDAGIGKYLYSGLDYLEYYSQFPAHNTVCVDGVSSYPVMMSQHAFRLVSSYPDAVQTGTTSPVTFSQVAFTEPESQSDQLRTNGIVKVDDTGGYYIDIFRSRKKEGGDKMHDYFYHNLGQTMTLTAANGNDLGLRPTEELAFAGGHLGAYSYIYDKSSATTAEDIKATFRVDIDEKYRPAGSTQTDITMTMWMRGYADREVFKALSPVNMEYERMKEQPYNIIEQPVLTFVARQKGEAWTRPFVAVFQPEDNLEPGKIASVSFFTPESTDNSAVGIEVTLKSGRKDYVFSASKADAEMSYKGMKVKGIYAVISNGKVLVEK